MRNITLILPHYRNQGMLDRQTQEIAGYPADVRDRLHLIVVDDCSPEGPPTMWSVAIASQRMYRITKKVRWNWIAARNIGVHEATTEWVLLTDIDHLVPAETMNFIANSPLDGNLVFRFSRVSAPAMTPYKPHPNSWFMTKANFDRIGGYDERFSGFYGSDGEFRDRIKARVSAVGAELLPQKLIRVGREVIPDASTKPEEFGRKTKEDGEGVARVRAEIARDPKPRTMTFPYERII